jgi:hypothetical protein
MKLHRTIFAHANPDYLTGSPVATRLIPAGCDVAILRTSKLDGLDMALVQHPDRTVLDSLKGDKCSFAWIPMSWLGG